MKAAIAKTLLFVLMLLLVSGCPMTTRKTCEKKGDVEKCVEYFHVG